MTSARAVGEGVLEPRAVEGADAVEGTRAGASATCRAVGCDSTSAAVGAPSSASVSGRPALGGRQRRTTGASAARSSSNGRRPVYSRWIASMLSWSATSSPTKASVSSAGVSCGRSPPAPRRGRSAADAVAVVAVGDQHVVARRAWSRIAAMRAGSVTRSTTCSTPSTVTAPTGSPGSASSSGQPGGQRQAPDRRQVGVGRPRQVEPVGRGLGRRALVGEHAAGALVDDLEPAEHARRGRGRAPAASVKRIRYSVNVGCSSRDHRARRRSTPAAAAAAAS